MKLLFGLFTILTVFSLRAKADMAHPWRDEDAVHGYTENVNPDQEETGVILYTIEDPARNDVKLKDKLFNEKLSKEISERYYERFGRTQAEVLQDRTPYLNTNFSEGQSMTFNEQDYQNQQRSFGSYVIRRVGEYQFDEQSKTNPDLQKVQEVKTKVQNVSLFDAGNFKFRANYQLAANTVIFKIVNPYLQISYRDEMSDHQRILEIGKDLGKGYSFLSDLYAVNPELDIVIRKAMTPTMSFTFTYSPFHTFQYTPTNSSDILTAQESRYLAGMDYKF